MKKYLSVIIYVVLVIVFLVGCAKKNGWIYENGKKHFYKEGVLVKNSWEDGYCLDGNGEIKTNFWKGDVYYGSDGQPYAYGIVDGISLDKNGRKIVPRNINELNQIITITPAKIIKTYSIRQTVITCKNQSNKTIKYITFSCTYYNTVGDIIARRELEATGPFSKGQGIGNDKAWGASDPYLFHRDDIGKVSIHGIDIDYMDGSSESITSDECNILGIK